MNYEKQMMILNLIELLIKELDRYSLCCDKIRIIKNLLKSKSHISNLDVQQKIMLDMKPIYDNRYNTKEIDRLLEDIYTLID